MYPALDAEGRDFPGYRLFPQLGGNVSIVVSILAVGRSRYAGRIRCFQYTEFGSFAKLFCSPTLRLQCPPTLDGMNLASTNRISVRIE